MCTELRGRLRNEGGSNSGCTAFYLLYLLLCLIAFSSQRRRCKKEEESCSLVVYSLVVILFVKREPVAREKFVALLSGGTPLL